MFQLNKSTFTKIEENTEKKGASEKSRATIIFSLKNEVGGLVKALRLFQVRTRVVKLTLYDKSSDLIRDLIYSRSFHINKVLSMMMDGMDVSHSNADFLSFDLLFRYTAFTSAVMTLSELMINIKQEKTFIAEKGKINILNNRE